MITTKLKLNKKPKPIIVGIVAAIILLIIFSVMAVFNYYAAEVTINGEKVGFVDDKDELSSLVDDVEKDLSKEKYNVKIDVKEEAIDVDPIAKPKEDVKMLDEAKLEEELIATDAVDAEAASINVDNKPVLYVGNQADANSVLNAIKEKYKVKGQDVKAKFREDVAVSDAAIDVNTNTLMSTDSAITYLLSGNEKIKKYKVKEDDTTWEIAKKHHVSEKAIKKANPKINVEKIKKGDVLNISKMNPFVHYEVSAVVSGKEKTKYHTKKIETDELYKGQTQVREKGKKGESYVTRQAIYVNGEVTKSKVLEEKVIKEPKTRVLIVGDKDKPASSSLGGSSYSGGGSYIGGNGTLSNPMRTLTMSSPFGTRWGRLHAGIDFSNPAGTAIYAAAGGTVIQSGWNGGYGNSITISHGNGLVTLYGHCSRLFVSDGEHVSRGEHIAAVGSTGNSTGNHLHFEVRVNGSPVNPWRYL